MSCRKRSHVSLLGHGVGLFRQFRHGVFESDDVLGLEDLAVEVFDLLFAQDLDLLGQLGRHQVLEEVADLFDHPERQELVDVTVRRLQLIVQITTAVNHFSVSVIEARDASFEFFVGCHGRQLRVQLFLVIRNQPVKSFNCLIVLLDTHTLQVLSVTQQGLFVAQNGHSLLEAGGLFIVENLHFVDFDHDLLTLLDEEAIVLFQILPEDAQLVTEVHKLALRGLNLDHERLDVPLVLGEEVLQGGVL